MVLDIFTLLSVLLLSYIANIGFALILYLGGNRFPGAEHWILAIFLVALGTMILLLRSNFPFELVALGNGVIIAAILAYAQAVWRFRWGKGYPIAFYFVAATVTVLLLLMRGQSVNDRNILFSLVFALANLWVFMLLVWKIPPAQRYTAWMAAVPFLIYTVGGFIQVVMSWSSEPIWDFFSLNQGHAILIFMSIITGNISLFGFYLLASVKHGQALSSKERELIKLNEDLRKSNQTKDQFVSLLAHDLRSPIGGVSRYIRKYLLAEDTDIFSMKRDLEIVNQSLEKAAKFLDDVLWWSRAQREDWLREPIHFDLSEAASATIKLLEPMAKEKEIRVDRALDPGFVWADFDTVLLISQNLLNNAIKFSHPGASIFVNSGVNASGQAFLRVQDYGQGIPPEFQDKLFRIDTKLSTPGTRGELGTGMGLVICREFAQKNGAKLILESHPGLGTTVELLFSS